MVLPPAALVLLNPSALDTALKVQTALADRGGSVVHRLEGRGIELPDSCPSCLFSSVSAHLQMLYQNGTPLIGICASGILIRALAPLLGDKKKDPPVLCLSEDGCSIVPLLGGHYGANDFAQHLAKALGGHAALTTAGETKLGFALDIPPEGWVLASNPWLTSLTARLLAGMPARLDPNLPFFAEARRRIPSPGVFDSEEETIALVVSTEPLSPHPNRLVFTPQTYSVGIGLARGCSEGELEALFWKTLQVANLTPAAVACLVSLDLKADEPALCALSERLNIPVRLFEAQHLLQETPRLTAPSMKVQAEVGCPSVAEAAALASVGPQGCLVIGKQKTKHATLALACAPHPLLPHHIGRARGAVFLIGLGPGSMEWRSGEANRLLVQADEIVGYGAYLDLVASLLRNKPCHRFPLGAEEARARFALERAALGRNIALICSGDPGIYAMAAPLFEILDRSHMTGEISEAARRVRIHIAPGISALQAAAARCGAPLGHDFCAISLSDLLTPWEEIERRLHAAGQGDFVIALYNPQSTRRRTPLEKTRALLLSYRSPSTPVIVARNLGRAGEHIMLHSLETWPLETVDMFSIVLVGSTHTKLCSAPGPMPGAGCNLGRPFVYTPRGYAAKHSLSSEEISTDLKEVLLQ